MQRIHYRTTRPLDPKEDAKLYVERPEDKTVAACVEQQDYVMLVGARRTGKTSLLHRLRLQLEHDYIPLFVDVMPFRESGKGWYRHIAEKMLDQLPERVDVNSIERAELLGFASNHIGFSKFLEMLAQKAKPTDRILVMVDEVGMVPSEIADPLFRVLRADYNNRAYTEFYRYIFVFAGVFEPVDLIRSGKGSIFDVAKKAYTIDTDINGVRQLVALLDPKVSDEIVRYIHDWTGGHLYLTQRLCSILDDQGVTTLTHDLVQQAIANIIADDDSIMHIREMLDSDKDAQSALKKVLAGKRLGWSNTMARRLNLIGVVKRDGKHNCVIRNRIFEKAVRDCFQEGHLAEGEREQVTQPMRPPAIVKAPHSGKGRDSSQLVVSAILAVIVFAATIGVLVWAAGQVSGTALIFIVIVGLLFDLVSIAFVLVVNRVITRKQAMDLYNAVLGKVPVLNIFLRGADEEKTDEP
ncbi:MAG: AAA-like domain-containing protein [Anaerolineales bacterium]|nr:AAA-like domain-containing protein [Anaerolineales bacterium]